MEDQIKKNYSENLKAEEYHQQLHKELLSIEPFFTFNLQFIYDILRSGRFKGSKMLEIGSGATVHYVASACSYFPNVIQSDFVADNREQLERWLNGRQGHLDWSRFLDLVAKVEGIDKDKKSSRQLLESRIRNGVKAVIKTDVLSDSIVVLEETSDPEVRPPYDLISSFWCLENVATDFDSYVSILKNIIKLLNPGGGIIIAGFENGGTWHVGEKAFHYLKLSLRDISVALDMAGFGKHDFKVHGSLDIDFGYKYETLFCVAAEKL